MAAAQYVNTPGYAALLLRRSFRDLMQPDSLIPRSKEWWGGKAHWGAQEKRWTFPSGASITFGYLDHEDDVRQYQGAAYQFVGFDELTQFTEAKYRYLFSRLRRCAGVDVPLRMRAGSNPGGVGHEWVKQRFIAQLAPDRVYIRALLRDNPSLDAAEYERSLAHLDPVTRAQLLEGDWEAYLGGRFKHEWLRRYYRRGEYYLLLTADGRPMDGTARPVDPRDCWAFMTVDPAASLRDTADYTVISTWLVTPRNELLWLDCWRGRLEVPDIVPKLLSLHSLHHPRFVCIESGGMQQGVYQEARRTRMVVKPMDPVATGRKLVRATPALILAETGRLYLPQAAPWREEAEGELLRFTGDEKQDAHDDVVDTVAYAAIVLATGGTGETFAPRVYGRV